MSGVERAADVNEVLAEQSPEELPLLGPLSDDAWLALSRMHVHLGPSDIDVTAQDQLASLGMQLVRPFREPGQEVELRRVVLAAVGDVHRGDHQVAQGAWTMRASMSKPG